MDHYELDKRVEGYRKDIVETLMRWVPIPSVQGEAAPGAPYGVEVRRMLDIAMADAQKLGFRTKVFDGHAGTAEMGEGDETLGIAVHLDVVPPGVGWTSPPFQPVLKDGRLYGRGAEDNKGAGAAALYAVRAVADLGIPFKRKVRIIFGCNEESGMRDMDYYIPRDTPLTMGFSPDGAFPLVNGERSLLHLLLSAPVEDDRLLEVRVAEDAVINQVPYYAEAKLHLPLAEVEAAIEGLDAEAQQIEDGVLLISRGVAAHAARPQLGKNAASQLLRILQSLGIGGPVPALANLVANNLDGAGLRLDVEDNIFGKTTCNLGILELKNGKLEVRLDIRYPASFASEEMEDRAKSALAGTGLSLSVLRSSAGYYYPPETPFIQSLLDAYCDVTGRERDCVTMSGGTYARRFPNMVAFGLNSPELPDCRIHSSDEFTVLEALMRGAHVMARAVAYGCLR